MAAVHAGESLTDLFEIRDNERLLELTFYNPVGTLYKGRESGALSVLNKLRLEGEAGFCDVILEVEGRQLTTHRCVLAANSQFFYTMFISGMKESNQKVAEQFGADELAEKANSYIKANFFTVVNNEEFVSISQKQLIHLISSDDIQVETEEEVYQSVLTWIKHDEANRVTVLPELLKHLRKDSLPKKFLESEMEREPLLMVTKSKGDSAPKKTRKRKGAKRSKKEKNEKSVLELRPSTEKHDVLIGFESRGTGKAFLYDLNKKEMVLLADESEFKIFDKVAVVGRTIFLMGESLAGNIHPRVRAVCFDDLKNQRSSAGENRKLEFESKASFKKKREVASLVSLNGLLYFIAGCDIVLENCFNTVECYNPDTNEWSFCAELNTARCRSGCVASEQSIYVIGGAKQEFLSETLRLSTVEKYDPERNSWSFVAPLKEARSSPRCVFVGDKIYAIGGIDSDGLRTSCCEVYSITTNEWQTIAQLPSPDFKIYNQIIIVEDQISVPFGLWQFSNEALQYTVQSNSWMKLANFCPSGKEGSFTVCIMKLPVFMLQKILAIAREFSQENWDRIETDEEDAESSDLEWSSDDLW